MKKDRVKNGGHLTKYFTQFPNLIDDSNLTPYEFRVLLHYYRVGECWEGVRTTADKCGMSTGKVTDVRRTLAEKGFIHVASTGDGVTIEVIDKTKENLEKYRSPDEHCVHGMNSTVHLMNTVCSPDEHKNNQLRITNEEVKAYALCVDFWLKEFHKGWSFRPVSGKALKSLIKQIQTLLAANDRDNGDDEVAAFFTAMCNNLPPFYKTKDLQVIDSKFNEIIEEIKKSKNGNFTHARPESKFRN